MRVPCNRRHFAHVLWASLCTKASGEPKAAHLTQDDFFVAGLAIGASEDEVRKSLGAPISVKSFPSPNDSEDVVRLLTYRDFMVHVRGDKLVFGFSLLGPRIRSKRGLRVGDSIQTLHTVYGQPKGSYESVFDYYEGEDEHQVVRVTVKNGRVTRIYVGQIAD